MKVEVKKIPGSILGGIEGMLVITWHRKGTHAGGMQMQDYEFEYLLRSPKRRTYLDLPPDVEAHLKATYSSQPKNSL